MGRWTAEEDSKLFEGVMNDRDVAAAIGRPFSAVRSRRFYIKHRLGKRTTVSIVKTDWEVMPDGTITRVMKGL